MFVEEGETLNLEVEPGTVIKDNEIKPGQGAEASALVVARGGKIFAEGTRCDIDGLPSSSPLKQTTHNSIFTDPEDFGSTDRGLLPTPTDLGS